MKIEDKVRIIERRLIADHRGWFLKAIDGHEQGLPGHTGEVYLTCGTGGQAKGGHYHPLAQEWFTLITGRATLHLQDVETGQTMRIALDAAAPVTVYIPPKVAHIVVNASAEDEFILLAYTDLLYDPTDTVPCAVPL